MRLGSLRRLERIANECRYCTSKKYLLMTEKINFSDESSKCVFETSH